MKKEYFLVLIFYSISFVAFSQKIDNLVSYRAIDNNHFFRFNYDNDYFAASDENYTQGYSFEFAALIFSKNPVNTVLIKPNDFKLQFIIALEHIGFTPDDYDESEIQFGDRPFAAAIMLKSSILAKNQQQGLRIHSSFNIGLIGPGAFGEEMQVGIHKATGNKTPRGWRHQIRNDIVLNYNLGFEKQIAVVDKFFSMQLQSNANVGTLFTNISVGANSVIGRFNDPFSLEGKKKNFQIYFYGQPIFTFVGYDATLQGGLFNRKSPYVILDKDIERFTFQFTYGMIIQSKSLFFEYTRSSITKEFVSGGTAKWGGVRVGFTF